MKKKKKTFRARRGMATEPVTGGRERGPSSMKKRQPWDVEEIGNV